MPQSKRMGRPLKNDVKRTEKIGLRVTVEEKQLITDVAEKIGQSRADTVILAINKLNDGLK